MLRYTELSAPQKRLIDEMRHGNELQYKFGRYTMTDGKIRWSIRTDTAWSLEKRHYIKECSFKDDVRVFCVNIEIEGFGTEF